MDKSQKSNMARGVWRNVHHLHCIHAFHVLLYTSNSYFFAYGYERASERASGDGDGDDGIPSVYQSESILVFAFFESVQHQQASERTSGGVDDATIQLK